MSEQINPSRKNTLFSTIDSKFFAICLLAILFFIPLDMIDNITESRSVNLNMVTEDISRTWGGSQKIVAPILSIPVKFTTEREIYNIQNKSYEKVIETKETIFNFLPQNLNIQTEILPEMRHKGIYNTLVYTAHVNISGDFKDISFPALSGRYNILWQRALLNIGIDPSMIRGEIKILFDGKPLHLNPGTSLQNITGISSPLHLTEGEMNKNFDISFSFNGSQAVSFAPLGKRNIFEVKSTWASPVFSGTFRPDSPQITDEGFTAKWDIPYIARNYQQIFTDKDKEPSFQINDSLATVSLLNTVSSYRNALRLSSYGIMFVALTFIMMFLFERRLGKNLHYAQYAVVGLALCLFFLTVMSLSEHIAFGYSYAAASFIVTAMISLYIYAALKNKKTAAAGGAVIAVLYIILYLMLSESDYALLIGTFILLSTLGIVMWETRNINTLPPEG